MQWVVYVTNDLLERPVAPPEVLEERLRRLRRSDVVSKAIQILLALFLDRDNRYERVHSWFLDWAADDDLKVSVARLRPPSNTVFRIVEPWQQLVLIRRAAELCPEDGISLDSQEGRTLYAECSLAAGDLSGPPTPPTIGDLVTDGLKAAAAAMQRLQLTNPPNPNNGIARLITVLDALPGRLGASAVESASFLRKTFADQVGVDLDSALVLISFLITWVMSRSLDRVLENPMEAWCDLEEWLAPTSFDRAKLGTLLARVSMRVEDIPELSSRTSSYAWVDPLVFRNRPLICSGNTCAVLMPELLLEKSTHDVLWWISPGPGQGLQPRTWQEPFGRLMEGYQLESLQSSAEATRTSFWRNVQWDPGEAGPAGELDGLMLADQHLAVFEASSGFLTHVSTIAGSWEQLRDAIERTFVRRGSYNEVVAQLARDITWLNHHRARRTELPPIAEWRLSHVQVIHPVALITDRSMRTPGVWRYLNRRLQELLSEVNTPWTIAPLAVMSVEDLDWVEGAIRQGHLRVSGIREGVMRILGWWQFDHHRYHAFWQLLDDYLGREEFRRPQLSETLTTWRDANIRPLFRSGESP